MNQDTIPKWTIWQIFAFRATLLALLLACNICYAQQTLTTEQINHLADAGKVYGYIKYFHPFLQYKTINWDSVFVANVEGIIQAKNKEEYAGVMQRMLSVLDDNLTGVVPSPKANIIYKVQPTTWEIKDSLLYINANDINDESYDKIVEAYQNIGRVKGVVFDMRKPSGSQFVYYTTSGPLVDWTIMYSGPPMLFKGELFVPSLRNVYHKGFFETSFKQVSAYQIIGKAEKNVLVVFIVENEGQLPLTAIALQQKGIAAIIQQEGKQLAPGDAKSFYVQDSVIVKIRVAEAINSDGSLAMVHPNATYSSTERAFTATGLARNMIINGFKSQGNSRQGAPSALSPPSDPTEENSYPSPGKRMLAAAKIFAEIDNLYPNKYLMDKNWEECYRTSISKFIGARDSLEYLRAVAELYSNISDSHGFITKGTFSLKLNPIIQGRGSFMPPVITNVIQNKVVVTGIYDDTVCKKIGLKKGDVIVSIDGQDPMKMIDEARKYQPASTKASQTFFVSKFLLFGDKGQIKKLKVSGAGKNLRGVKMPTLKEYSGQFFGDSYSAHIYCQHIKPTFKLLNKTIGYVDVTSPLSERDVDSVMKAFRNTKAIILDDRGYPHYEGGYKLGKWLAKNPNVVLARYRENVVETPNIEQIGTAQDNFNGTYLNDQSDFKESNSNSANVKGGYRGKVIILINEAAQSWSEDIALKSKYSNNAILIGSPTSGTDGVMTSFAIPGNITLFLSSDNVSSPDGKTTQRVGVKPDITVYPTIKGLQAGKDEVLDRAVKFIETGK